MLHLAHRKTWLCSFNNFLSTLIIFSTAYAHSLIHKNAINSYLVTNVVPYVICSVSKCCIRFKNKNFMFIFQIQ